MGERNVPFCETNPPFFVRICYTTCYTHESYGENGREISVGSFWKTNPPGGGNEVVLIEKWVRFQQTEALLTRLVPARLTLR
jgi:hypothetical protein